MLACRILRVMSIARRLSPDGARIPHVPLMTKLRLFGNAFSPFAKGAWLEQGSPSTRWTGCTARAAGAGGRIRAAVPVLVDGDTVVANSAHIVAYLEDAYPLPSVLPGDASARARIRDWERLADTLLDPIVVDASLWSWANRHDTPPPGLREAAARDLAAIYARIESQLAHRGIACAAAFLADMALFPNLYATRVEGRRPGDLPAHRCLDQRLAAMPLFAADLIACARGSRHLTAATGSIATASSGAATGSMAPRERLPPLVPGGNRAGPGPVAGHHRGRPSPSMTSDRKATSAGTCRNRVKSGLVSPTANSITALT
jgi:glutathione S-transferase